MVKELLMNTAIQERQARNGSRNSCPKEVLSKLGGLGLGKPKLTWSSI